MWAAVLIGFAVGGPFGVCLLIAAGITASIKAWKVDAEYAKRGEMPPSARLVDKWMSRRSAAGRPVKPAKYGMLRYGWQRWQAMWEDLAETHRDTRDRYRQAVAKAKRDGNEPPPKPSFTETLKGWKWQLPTAGPNSPAAERSASGQAQPVTKEPAEGAAAAGNSQASPAPRPGAAPTVSVPPASGQVNSGRWPHAAPSRKCRRCSNSPVVDARLELCGVCLTTCGRCRNPGTHRRDEDGFRFIHDANSATTCLPKPAAADADTGTARTCWQCGTQHPPFACPVDAARWDQAAAGTSPNDQQGDSMPANTTAAGRSGEVTGIPSAIAYERTMAAVHYEHADNEPLVTGMAAMKVGEGDLGLVRKAMADSAAAGAAFTRAADELEKNNAAVREGYGSAPDAADKQYQVA